MFHRKPPAQPARRDTNGNNRMTFANGTVGDPNSFGVDAQLANLTPYLDCTIDESSVLPLLF